MKDINSEEKYSNFSNDLNSEENYQNAVGDGVKANAGQLRVWNATLKAKRAKEDAEKYLKDLNVLDVKAKTETKEVKMTKHIADAKAKANKIASVKIECDGHYNTALSEYNSIKGMSSKLPLVKKEIQNSIAKALLNVEEAKGYKSQVTSINNQAINTITSLEKLKFNDTTTINEEDINGKTGGETTVTPSGNGTTVTPSVNNKVSPSDVTLDEEGNVVSKTNYKPLIIVGVIALVGLGIFAGVRMYKKGK